MFLLGCSLLSAQEIKIEENEIGFCSVDGQVVTSSGSISGWSGDGYADTDLGIGKSISWEVFVAAEGDFSFVWRYANGGGDKQDRSATLVINGVVALDTVHFPNTVTWNDWTFSTLITVHLSAGNNKIRIEAQKTNGLGNYDYFKIIGAGVSAADCTPSYVISVKSSNDNAGTVSYEPVKNYYDAGTQVTLRAHAKAGYFFQSWTGEETSSDSVFTFTVKGNVNAVARFLPDGTKMDDDIYGYAAIQDDNGTPYLVTGGALGETVEVSTLQDLQNYLGSSKPYVVKFSGQLTGTETIKIASDKTLLGIGDNAHLKGIELSINEARNVVIRNIIVSHVTPQDAVEINNKSKNIVIDHCEFYSDRDHGQDYYDGLLDIKNESSFITISWCSFHDHYKTSLISSGDQAVADSVIRITYHHNYFYNCGSRLPSIRFGKAHVFNNYYKNDETAINSRMGAWVRVEKNYFENVGKAVFMDYSTQVGSVQLIDNHFGGSAYTSEPSVVFDVPYQYQNILDEKENLPSIITNGVKTDVADKDMIITSYKLFNYPNPFNPETNIYFALPKDTHVILKIYNIVGQEIAILANRDYRAGEYTIPWNANNLSAGVYFYSIITTDFTQTKKMLLLK